jgi:hypothetical protein
MFVGHGWDADFAEVKGRNGPSATRKKPAGMAGFAIRVKRVTEWRGLHRLGQFGVEFDGVRMIALHLVEAVAPFQHAIEFVHEERDGFVAFVGGDGGVEVGSLDAHMAFGDEAVIHGLFGVTFQLHADANNAFLVSKQSIHFFTDERFEGGSEFEVNTGNDQFVLVVLSVHDHFVFGFN